MTPPERKRLVWVVLLMAFGVGLEALTLGLVAPASSIIFGEKREEFLSLLPGSLGNLDPSLLIAILLFVGILFVVLKNVIIGYQIRVQFGFIAKAKQSVSSRLFSNYLRAPYSFHLTHNSSALIRNVVNEVNEFELRVLMPWMLLLSEALVTFGLITVLLVLNPINTLAVGLLLGLGGAGYLLVTRGRVDRWGHVRLENEELRIRSVQQGLGGIKEVKLLGLEDVLLEDYKVYNKSSAEAFAAQAFFSQVPRLLLEVIALSAVIVVVFISLLSGLDTEEMVTSLGLLAVAAFRLLPSTNRIISACSSLKFGAASLNNVAQELAESEKVEQFLSEQRESEPITFSSSIDIEGLSYQYREDSKKVLDQISLKIPHNAFVGVIGESGSGKSTLVDVILGLLPPTEGQVKVDGVPISSNLRSWQEKIAYVPQHIYLADTSIRKNVAFGIPDDEISSERVEEMLKLAHLESLMADLEDGIDTEVGERGVRLSGGQCQRIGVARALYRDPAVIVFDEATSALDDDSQEKVMDAIKGLKGSRTIIMISHRLSTIDYCDVVFELKGGKAGPLVSPESVLESR